MNPDVASSAGVEPSERGATPFDALVAVLYADLRGIARRERFRARAGATLCTTALINEAWLKLQRSHGWEGRQHFLATAALAMRQVLVNDVLARRSAKRDHGLELVDLDEAFDAAAADDDETILQVSSAVERLSALSPRLARIVECRFFAGFNDIETADALGVTDRTVRRDWLKARAWLYRELGESADLIGERNESA
jgi:RNA polymerase sigma factor (TIGR02999 family)